MTQTGIPMASNVIQIVLLHFASLVPILVTSVTVCSSAPPTFTPSTYFALTPSEIQTLYVFTSYLRTESPIVQGRIHRSNQGIHQASCSRSHLSLGLKYAQRQDICSQGVRNTRWRSDRDYEDISVKDTTHRLKQARHRVKDTFTKMPRGLIARKRGCFRETVRPYHQWACQVGK